MPSRQDEARATSIADKLPWAKLWGRLARAPPGGRPHRGWLTLFSLTSGVRSLGAADTSARDTSDASYRPATLTAENYFTGASSNGPGHRSSKPAMAVRVCPRLPQLSTGECRREYIGKALRRERVRTPLWIPATGCRISRQSLSPVSIGLRRMQEELQSNLRVPGSSPGRPSRAR